MANSIEEERRKQLKELYIDLLVNGGKVKSVTEFQQGGDTCYSVAVEVYGFNFMGIYNFGGYGEDFSAFEKRFILRPSVKPWEVDIKWIKE